MTYTTPDGTMGLMAAVWDWTPESLRLTQFAMKLRTMWEHGQDNQPCRIEVTCRKDEPPVSAVGLARGVGGVLFWGPGRVPVAGRPGDYPAENLDWQAIHTANSTMFAQEHSLDGSLDSLRRVDELLEAAHLAAREQPAKVDGDMLVLAGTYTSEVMRAAVGGTWDPPKPETGLPSLRMNLGRNGASSVSMIAKVRQFLQNGPGDAVHPAATFLADRVIPV